MGSIKFERSWCCVLDTTTSSLRVTQTTSTNTICRESADDDFTTIRTFSQTHDILSPNRTHRPYNMSTTIRTPRNLMAHSPHLCFLHLRGMSGRGSVLSVPYPRSPSSGESIHVGHRSRLPRPGCRLRTIPATSFLLGRSGGGDRASPTAATIPACSLLQLQRCEGPRAHLPISNIFGLSRRPHVHPTRKSNTPTSRQGGGGGAEGMSTVPRRSTYTFTNAWTPSASL